MRVLKVLGVIVGVLLLVILVPVVLGMIARSSLIILVVITLSLVMAALLWGRVTDSFANKSWFIRLHDQGATQMHDRLLQDDDTMRERADAQRTQRRHDA